MFRSTFFVVIGILLASLAHAAEIEPRTLDNLGKPFDYPDIPQIKFERGDRRNL